MVATQSSSSKGFRLASMTNMFRAPDLRNKIFFTLGIVLIYRLGAFIREGFRAPSLLSRSWRDVGVLRGR